MSENKEIEELRTHIAALEILLVGTIKLLNNNQRQTLLMDARLLSSSLKYNSRPSVNAVIDALWSETAK